MFNFQQQPLLDAYQADQISLDELSNKYKGTEGFALEHYGYILEVAKKLGVKLVAGFVPKPFCSMMVNEGKNHVLEKIEIVEDHQENFMLMDLRITIDTFKDSSVEILTKL